MDNNSEKNRALIREAVQKVVGALSLRNDDALHEVFHRSRVEREDAYRVMDEYGADFGAPPLLAYEDIEISRAPGPEQYYTLDVYLWDNQGKRTDLSAILTVVLKNGEAEVELDDLRVM